MIRDAFLPFWLLKLSYFNPGIYQLGFALGFVSLVVIAYKLKQTRDNEFTNRLVYIFYTGIFWTGLNMFLYRPGYTGLISTLLALPMLVSHIYLAIFMVWRYGIGGKTTHEND